MENVESVFNQIVKEYSERVYWHVRRFVNSHEDADDLVQDIFLKIWTALPSFRGEAQLFTWVYRIATNETLNWLRREKVRAALRFTSVDAEMEKRIDNDPFFDGDAADRALSKAVAKLPEKQRQVFILLGKDSLLLVPRGLVDKGRAVRIQGLGEVGEIGPSVVLRGDGRLAEDEVSEHHSDRDAGRKGRIRGEPADSLRSGGCAFLFPPGNVGESRLEAVKVAFRGGYVSSLAHTDALLDTGLSGRFNRPCRILSRGRPSLSPGRCGRML